MDNSHSSMEGAHPSVNDQVTLQNNQKLWAFIFIDDDVAEAGLSPNAFRVYCQLCWHGRKAHTCFPGLETLAKICGICRNTVISALQELAERKFINIQKTNGRVSRYFINPKTVWCPDCESTSPNFERVPIQNLNPTSPNFERVPVQNMNPNHNKDNINKEDKADRSLSWKSDPIPEPSKEPWSQEINQAAQQLFALKRKLATPGSPLEATDGGNT